MRKALVTLVLTALLPLAVISWDKARRVIVLRRAAKTDLALSRKVKRAQGLLTQLGE